MQSALARLNVIEKDLSSLGLTKYVCLFQGLPFGGSRTAKGDARRNRIGVCNDYKADEAFNVDATELAVRTSGENDASPTHLSVNSG